MLMKLLWLLCCRLGFVLGASQSWCQLQSTIIAVGQNYTTFTTAKSMLSSSTATAASAGVIQLPPGFWQLGGTLSIEWHAAVSWASGNTMTITINVGSVAAFVSDAIKVTTTGGTTEGCTGKLLLTCRAIGNGTLANLIGGGYIQGRMICPPGATAGANYAAGMGFSSLKEGTPAAGTGFDSTVANTLDFLVAMGTSSASNGWRMEQYNVIARGTTSP